MELRTGHLRVAFSFTGIDRLVSKDNTASSKQLRREIIMNNEDKIGLSVVSVMLIALIAFLVLAPRQEKVLIKSYYKEFEVLRINRPKHFSVTLLDLDNHVLFEDVGDSKHCNSWDDPGRPTVHSKITVKVYEYYNSDDPKKISYYSVYDKSVNDLFCR